MMITRNGNTVSDLPTEIYAVLHPNGLSITNIAVADARFAALQGWHRLAGLAVATGFSGRPAIGWVRPSAAGPWQPPN